MTVKELKEMVKDVPDEWQVFLQVDVSPTKLENVYEVTRDTDKVLVLSD